MINDAMDERVEGEVLIVESQRHTSAITDSIEAVEETQLLTI